MAKYALKWLAYRDEPPFHAGYLAPFACVPVDVTKGWQGRVPTLQPCVEGYHFPRSTTSAVGWWMPWCMSSHLWLIEVDADGMVYEGDKAVAHNIRYIEMIGKPTTPSGIRRAIKRAFDKYGEENFIV